jgi:hypothetical protein
VSVWLRGLIAAGWAVMVGLASLVVLSLVVWAADSQSVASAGGAMRFAAQLWLLADRTPLRTTGGALTLPPLALTIGLGLLLARGAAIVARQSRCSDARDVGTVVGAVVAPYAVLAAVIAALSPSSTLHPSIGAAFICAAIVGAGFATIGAVRGAGPGVIGFVIPEDLREALGAARASALVLLGAATVLAVGSLIAHGHDFATIVNGYRDSPGKLAMVGLSILFIPNAVLFALAYLVGPGFAVGTGTSVGLGGVHIGAVPAFPLLAAVPTRAASAPVIALSVLSIVAAGLLGGWRLQRGSGAGRPLADRMRQAILSGAMVGLAAAVLTGVAGGPSGPGRLRAVGPSPWRVGLMVTVEIAGMAIVVALASAAIGWLRLRPGRRPSP